MISIDRRAVRVTSAASTPGWRSHRADISIAVGILAVAVSLILLFSGCRHRSERARSTTPRAGSTAVPFAQASGRSADHDRRSPRADDELATTSAAIFFSNLRGMIAGTERRLADEPASAAARRDLSSLLYTRAKHEGDPTELARALSLVSEAITLDANDGAAYLSRANQLQTMHRFSEARRDLESARTTGAPAEDVAALEAEIDYAQGRYATAIPVIRKTAAARRTSATIARLALLEHDLGNAEEAERLFSEAEGLVRDPNPIPVAWLNLQRGIHCQSIGQLERAAAFFTEAARRIPQYVAAEEHLAETLHALGRDDEASRLYEVIVGRSPDPEFRGALASLYRARGRTADADRLVKEATEAYTALLVKFPEAMYWHASEFFLGEGSDPKRALELLKMNAHLRPSAASLVALARAYLIDGDPSAAKTVITRALATPVVSADAFWTAARVEHALAVSLPKEEAARVAARIDSLRARARALNPRIEAEQSP